MVGFAVGLAIFTPDNPALGVHKYVTPPTGVIPICIPVVFETHVLVKELPALTAGISISTETVTLSLAVQPLIGCVAVKVYVVVWFGFAIVEAAFGLFNPTIGVQA